MNDKQYMKLALDLAAKGIGLVNPNPLVGAVIVKDGEIIGQGWHKKYGGLHAEREALANCSKSPEGATMYVTLEPCCHHGKTPPCTTSIIASGIKKVVAATLDPNPLVKGKGLRILQESGIKTETGLLEDEALKLNAPFIHYITKKLPYVVMKYAMTLDGKIATRTGKSKWITGSKAREHVHKSRGQLAAIMVGIGTVITDDPLLTCRLPGGRNPVRIICDTNLRLPLNSKIAESSKEVTTYVATASEDQDRIKVLEEKGCKVLKIGTINDKIDLSELAETLGAMGIDSILLEGGGELNYNALKSGIVSRIQAYIAPIIFGGGNAKSPVAGLGAASPNDAFRLTNRELTLLDEDILIEYEVINDVYRDN